MRPKLMVVDLELTCWDDPARADDMEIIEIGLCVFDCLTGEISRESSTLVRPRLLEVSERCHRITGLTAERLRKGVPLDEALRRLRKRYPFRSSCWAAWGEGDRRRMLSECAAKDIPYPFADSYLNVSQLYSMFTKTSRKVNLEEALGQLGMGFEGQPHRGVDDARNAARVLRRTLGWGTT